MIAEQTKKRLWVAYFGVILCWSIQAYLLLGQWLSDGELLALKIDGRPYISDFVNVYSAGVLASRCLAGPVNIYDSAVQTKLQNELVAPTVPERPFYNQYPPLMFVVFLPLSLFDKTQAWVLWVLVAFAASMVAVATAILPFITGRFARAVTIVAFMAAYPTWLSFRLGQTSLLLFPLLTFYWYLLQRRKFSWAALTASLMMVKLQYLPIIALIGTALGGFSFVAGFAISSALLLALATSIVGWSNICQFPHALLFHEASSQVSGVSADMMQNFRGILVLLCGADTTFVQMVAAAGTVIVAAALFVAWRRIDTKNADHFYLLASVTTLSMLFSSPHTHIQDYIMALLPCAWLFHVADSQSTILTSKGRLRCKALALSFPIASWLFYLLLPLFHFVKIQPYAVWGIATACVAGIELFRVVRVKTSDEARLRDENISA